LVEHLRIDLRHREVRVMLGVQLHDDLAALVRRQGATR
jgi:hypothetical protein